jgi:hypothetical protein
MAIAAGAAGVGVGSAVNQLDNEVAMVAAVRSLVEALATVETVGAHRRAPDSIGKSIRQF